MKLASNIKTNRTLLVVYIGLTVCLFVGRVVVFSARQGVEHDSGWMLSVARTLAEKGVYASTVNTVVSNQPGAQPSIHDRPSVQDANGLIYFPAGVTVGPAYIVPEALAIKVLGSGFWQFRIVPLTFFALLLLLLFFVAWQLGGLAGLIILQAWLWLYPQLYLNFAYEHLAEHVALTYLILAVLCIVNFFRNNRHPGFYLGAGLCFSLAVLTKFISLIYFLVFIVWFSIEIVQTLKSGESIKRLLQRWLYFGLGLIVPMGGFQLVRFYSLTHQFGQAGWKAANTDFQLIFRNNGSGVDGVGHFSWAFINQKLMLWRNLDIRWPLLFWGALFALPFACWGRLAAAKRTLTLILYGTVLTGFGWFVLFSPNGWLRYVYIPIWIAILLVSALLGNLLSHSMRRFSLVGSLVAIMAITAITPIAISKDVVSNFTVSDGRWEEIYQQRLAKDLQSFPSLPTVPGDNQRQLQDYISTNLSTSDQIYYNYWFLVNGWFLVAEMSALTDRVFYPIDRRLNNPELGRDYLIFGPYQKGPRSFLSTQDLNSEIDNHCKNIVFQNNSYSLCQLKDR